MNSIDDPNNDNHNNYDSRIPYQNIIFPNARSIKLLSRKIRQNETKLSYRLRSIIEDATYVKEFHSIYSSFPCYANLQCGQWYINNTIETNNQKFESLLKTPLRCYFKSTDGHCHHWKFSLNRLNIHILQALSNYGGAIIVDSTRRGKRFPDSFTRTIPIWCCVMNQIIFKYKTEADINSNTISDEDSKLWHTLHLPSSVSQTERALIEEHLEEWKNICLKHGGIYRELKTACVAIRKPIRPLWISRSTAHWDNADRSFSQVPFTPLLLLNPCEVENETGENRAGWTYIQGAGDDDANWSRGMSASLFWKHALEFDKSQDVIDCEQWVDKIVRLSKLQGLKNTEEMTAQIFNKYRSYQIESTPLQISHCETIPTRHTYSTENILVYINVTVKSTETAFAENQYGTNAFGWIDSQCLLLNVDGTPKSKRCILDHFPRILAFISQYISSDHSILICSNDLAFALVVCAAICLKNYVLIENSMLIPFANHSDPSTKFIYNNQSYPSEITKLSIRSLLNYLKQFHPIAVFPSRILLKQLNLYFLGATSSA